MYIIFIYICSQTHFFYVCAKLALQWSFLRPFYRKKYKYQKYIQRPVSQHDSIHHTTSSWNAIPRCTGPCAYQAEQPPSHRWADPAAVRWMGGVLVLLCGAELCRYANRDLSSGHTGDYLHSQRSRRGREHTGSPLSDRPAGRLCNYPWGYSNGGDAASRDAESCIQRPFWLGLTRAWFA